MGLDFLDELLGIDKESLIHGHVGPLVKLDSGAIIGTDARVTGRARIGGSVQVLGNARVGGFATVAGDTIIRGKAIIGGFAVILGGVWETESVVEGAWHGPGIHIHPKTDIPRYRTNKFSECWVCGSHLDSDNQAPSMRNEVWLVMFPRTWIVCLTCVESKLGRKVTPDDI